VSLVRDELVLLAKIHQTFVEVAAHSITIGEPLLQEEARANGRLSGGAQQGEGGVDGELPGIGEDHQGTEVVARRKEQEFGGVVGVAHAGRAGLGDRGAGDGRFSHVADEGVSSGDDGSRLLNRHAEGSQLLGREGYLVNAVLLRHGSSLAEVERFMTGRPL
jgi:hypothetical protein